MGVLLVIRKWGSWVIYFIAAYDVIVTQYVPPAIRDKYLLGTLGWSLQTWVIIILSTLLLTFMFDKYVTEKNKGNNGNGISASVGNRGNATAFGGGLHGDLVYGDKVHEKKPRLKEANFAFESSCDIWEGTVGVRLFNNSLEDFTEKSAELIGFAQQTELGLNNLIHMIPHEQRGLTWYEKDDKIIAGGHGFFQIVMIDWEGFHFGNWCLHHNTDAVNIAIGVEVNGKLGIDPIVKRQCCITFYTHKEMLNNKERWLIGVPKLTEGDCDWIKMIPLSEALKKMKKA